MRQSPFAALAGHIHQNLPKLGKRVPADRRFISSSRFGHMPGSPS
jgi:hypothetical protein